MSRVGRIVVGLEYRFRTHEPIREVSAVSVVQGVSHLLHTKQSSHLRALLDKLGNIEGEVLDRLIDLNVVLPGCGRPNAIMIFFQPSQQPHP